MGNMDYEWRRLSEILPEDGLNGFVAVYNENNGAVSTASYSYCRQVGRKEGWTHWAALPNIPVRRSTGLEELVVLRDRANRVDGLESEIDRLRREVDQWMGSFRLQQTINTGLLKRLNEIADIVKGFGSNVTSA